jgi:hypothetical protein
LLAERNLLSYARVPEPQAIVAPEVLPEAPVEDDGLPMRRIA